MIGGNNVFDKEPSKKIIKKEPAIVFLKELEPEEKELMVGYTIIEYNKDKDDFAIEILIESEVDILPSTKLIVADDNVLCVIEDEEVIDSPVLEEIRSAKDMYDSTGGIGFNYKYFFKDSREIKESLVKCMYMGLTLGDITFMCKVYKLAGGDDLIHSSLIGSIEIPLELDYIRECIDKILIK